MHSTNFCHILCALELPNSQLQQVKKLKRLSTQVPPTFKKKWLLLLNLMFLKLTWLVPFLFQNAIHAFDESHQSRQALVEKVHRGRQMVRHRPFDKRVSFQITWMKFIENRKLNLMLLFLEALSMSDKSNKNQHKICIPGQSILNWIKNIHNEHIYMKHSTSVLLCGTLWLHLVVEF